MPLSPQITAQSDAHNGLYVQNLHALYNMGTQLFDGLQVEGQPTRKLYFLTNRGLKI